MSTEAEGETGAVLGSERLSLSCSFEGVRLLSSINEGCVCPIDGAPLPLPPCQISMGTVADWAGQIEALDSFARRSNRSVSATIIASSLLRRCRLSWSKVVRWAQIFACAWVPWPSAVFAHQWQSNLACTLYVAPDTVRRRLHIVLQPSQAAASSGGMTPLHHCLPYCHSPGLTCSPIFRWLPLPGISSHAPSMTAAL